MKKKILIVDDDEEICDELSEILKDRGYAAEVAFDGIKAIALLVKNKYHLVLLDLKLPGASGFEILRLARHRDLPVKILVVTGRPMVKKALKEKESQEIQEEEKALKLANGIISKPFAVRELLARIEDLVR